MLHADMQRALSLTFSPLNIHMCCETCACLGLCAQPPWKKDPSRNVLILPNCEHDAISRSALGGCEYCNLILQAYPLLEPVDVELQVDIRLNVNRPAEISACSIAEGERGVVEIFAVEDSSPALSLPSFGKDVAGGPGSNDTFHFINSCLQACLKTHPKCRQETSKLPKRVVDIATAKYRIFEPETAGVEGTYAALSYRWANWKPLTIKNALEDFKKEIDPELMPLLFQDAAIVARKLGINFLWIDSLCIIHDDRDDWTVEVAKMAEIYENAVVVISASWAPNPGRPFLRPRDHTIAANSIPLKFRDSLGVVRARKALKCGLHAKKDAPERDTLDHRAWTFQEKELARRWISFSRSEVQWKCNSVQSCQCRTVSCAPQSLLAYTLLPAEELYYQWHLIVEEYTARDLTEQTDKLPAIMGLAKKFTAMTGATYVAGVWKENLIRDLLWCKSSNVSFDPATRYLAPTFSWASVSCSVTYRPERWFYGGERIFHSKVTNASISTAGNEPYSIVQDGLITLEGPVVYATLSSSSPGEPDSYRLTVAGRQYLAEVTAFGNGSEMSGCEFTIDSLPTTRNIQNEGTDGEQVLVNSRALKSDNVPETLNEMTVKLISLCSLVNVREGLSALAYENFLIIAPAFDEESRHQRVGSGTGKIFKLQQERNSPNMDSPFAWVPGASERQDSNTRLEHWEEVISIA